jgi:hypothetical protein
MTDVAEDTTQLQNAVRSFLSAMKPEESVAFASLVYLYLKAKNREGQKAILACSQIGRSFFRGKGTDCEVGHSSLSSAEIKII